MNSEGLAGLREQSVRVLLADTSLEKTGLKKRCLLFQGDAGAGIKKEDCTMPHGQLLMLISKSKHIYKGCCLPVCRKYGLSQTGLDVLLFLANNPEYNSARDICRIRGIESGIVSVTVESLIRTGRLIRLQDPDDRRIQRLGLMPQASCIVEEGQNAQKTFWEEITRGFTGEELGTFAGIMDRMMDNIDRIDAGVKQND